MARSLLGRLHALSDAHSLVRRSFNPDSKATAVAIRDVIEAVLRPYRPPIVTGPKVRLGERATSSAALVFHELATNAAKYGALSNEDGIIRIDWRIDGENLSLSWTEDAGLPIPQSRQPGFGSTLIESTIAALRGTIAHDWRPTGLSVAITLPLKSLDR
jgi:two-component sensor histidine kinase